MKNTKLFPFERNKYFYGKLLSVDDFELEQDYMNNKRRMLNRYLNGCGVVAGLYVVGLDEQTISVEAGIALDATGRELVMDVPVVKKLSMLDGFGACLSGRDRPYIYLCLEYGETETDRVHNVTKNARPERDGEDVDYNKIREGCRLYLTDREPELENMSPSALYEDVKTVYWKDGVRICQIMPRYVRSGNHTEMRVTVENLGRKTISFSYDLILTCLLHENQAKLRVSFDEMLVERTGSYELVYRLDTTDSANVEGTLAIDPDTVRLSVSGQKTEERFEGRQTVRIGREEEKAEMVRSYYRAAMENIAESGSRQPIYLARIFFVEAGDTYIIERIDNVPFRQYVKNGYLETALDQMMMRELKAGERAGCTGGRRQGGGGGKEEAPGIAVSKGTAVIPLAAAAQRGERFFSDEIIHGLGLGRVAVVLGTQRDEENLVTYGSSEVFEKEGVEAEVAARLDVDKGSFVIGARLLSPTQEGRLEVHWTAVRDMRDAVQEKSDKRIYITPGILELHVRESHYLEAVCENMLEKAVRWSVKDQAGTVDARGYYTAPNVPGVYEVVAQSVAFPEVRASIFVVVRDYDA